VVEKGGLMARVPPRHWEYRVTIAAPPGDPSEITEASEGFAEFLGYTSGALENHEVMGLVAHADRELLHELCTSTMTGWDGRLRLLSASGEVLWVELEAEIDQAADGGRTAIARVHDIGQQVELEAALREREARLHALNERLRILMWSFDTSLHVTWMWGSGLQELGLEENQLIGLSLQEYLGTEDPSNPALAASFRALLGERVEYELDWQNRLYRASVGPLRGPDNEILGVSGAAIDVTDSPELLDETVELGRHLGAPRLRSSGAVDPNAVPEIITVGPLRIDVGAHSVMRDDLVVDLTPTEFRLLTELARRPGRVLSRGVLLNRVWGHDFLGGGSLITMAVKRLRSKIEEDPSDPQLIETVRGIGYRLRVT
jgi:PAS domain S-box-containing protein